MPFTHAFLVPDIYPSFRCKGGSCRSTCCKGWGISVRMEEYFRLLGMDCPPEIRRRLDCAFYAPKAPSPERFRLINPRFDGDCPLRAEDGLCALQLACDKFIRRFRRVEALADKPLDQLDLPALEGLWRRAKEETET